MIDEIHVSDLALIHDAVLAPGPGLTVLTGETGAGKTALLSACRLLMGDRADSSLVREGQDAAYVVGRLFRDSHDCEGTVVSRRVGSDGRSRVRIDGAMASVRELNRLVGAQIDLCGQHEHQRLLDPATHVEMVDAWAGSAVAAPLAAYRSAFDIAREASCELERVESAARTQGARLEDARFALTRIDEVDPGDGELEELDEVLPRAEHAEALVGCAHGAEMAIAGDGGALDTLNGAIAELARLGSVDSKLAEFADGLASATIAIEDIAADLRRYRDDIEFDPERLQRAQARHAELKGLLRQFGPTMADVMRRRDEARELLSLVDDGETRIRLARDARDEAEANLALAARALMRARNSAAPRFCREVGKQMARLEMGHAELVWDSRELPRDKWTSQGPATCELLYRSGSGMTPRPLRRIASGGELSRVMLASKVVLGQADGVDTLVFDEVDAGVGGSTARALGLVLSDLARTHQVIVVTHLAQVAVMGDTHYVVSKSDGDLPETSLTRVEGPSRVREIARMLSGDESEASLEHAREMLREVGNLQMQ